MKTIKQQNKQPVIKKIKQEQVNLKEAGCVYLGLYPVAGLVNVWIITAGTVQYPQILYHSSPLPLFQGLVATGSTRSRNHDHIRNQG